MKFRILIAISLACLTGCAAHRVTPHPTPSVTPIREKVTTARATTTKAVESTKRAQTAIEESKGIVVELAKNVRDADQPLVMKLQIAQATAEKELANTQDQLAATIDSLSKALLESDTLQKKVQQQTDDLNAANDNLDQALHERDKYRTDSIKQTKLAWKWRIIAIVSNLLWVAAIFAFFYFKATLKSIFPWAKFL